MYLSAVANRDLSGELAPWADGVNADHFVVIDSNVDLFLQAVYYDGPMTYRARRAFVQALATRVHLGELYQKVQQLVSLHREIRTSSASGSQFNR